MRTLLRENPPAILLRIGDVPVAPSGATWRTSLPEVFSVTRTGFSGLARPPPSSPETWKPFCTLWATWTPWGTSRPARHEQAQEGPDGGTAHHLPDSEQAMVRAFSCFAADGDCIYLGNSMPVRYWNSFAQMAVPTETSAPTAGPTALTGKSPAFWGSHLVFPFWALVGPDRHVRFQRPGPPPQLDKGRVLGVINNGGGGIFRALPGRPAIRKPCVTCLSAPPTPSRPLRNNGACATSHRTAEDFDQLDALEENSQVLAELIPDGNRRNRSETRWLAEPFRPTPPPSSAGWRAAAPCGN
ncbi:MAG: hypothetical protein ACLT8E_02920 [Akkermansia sp.]